MAAGWLESLLATDVSGLKTVRARYRLQVAKAERQARLEAGKRPLKPRTEAERMAAAAKEPGTDEGGELEPIRVDRLVRVRVDEGAELELNAAPRRKGKKQ
jgi:hypothetical protein